VEKVLREKATPPLGPKPQKILFPLPLLSDPECYQRDQTVHLKGIISLIMHEFPSPIILCTRVSLLWVMKAEHLKVQFSIKQWNTVTTSHHL
jgi:hypothetical protein